MIRAVPFLLLLLALGLAACGDDRPALSGDLSYVRSGGVAGDHDELVIQPDGAATLKSRRGGEKRFELSDEELDALAAEAATMRTSQSVSDPAAPDARTHRIEYDGKLAASDDPRLKSSGIRALVVQLEKILQAHR